MTTLPILSDADWARLSWRAKQQWLTTADKLRREMTARLERQATREATQRIIAEHAIRAGIDPAHYDVARSLAIAREIHAHLPTDPDGPAHLAALDPRAGDSAQADRYRARNARRQTVRRAS